MYKYSNKERTKRRRVQHNSNDSIDDPPSPREKGDPIFRHLLFYLDQDTINISRRSVLHGLIEKYGGRFTTTLTNYVTHILVDEGFSNGRLSSTFTWTTYPHQMEVIMVTWLSASINANECLNTIGYQVRRNRRPSILKNVRTDMQGAVYSSHGKDGSSEGTKFDYVSEENSTFDDGKYDDETSCEDDWLASEPPDIYILPTDPIEYDSPSPSVQEVSSSKEILNNDCSVISSTTAAQVDAVSSNNKPEGEAPFASSNPIVARLSKVRVRIIPKHLRVPGESAVVVELNNEDDPPLPFERGNKVNNVEPTDSEKNESSAVSSDMRNEEALTEAQVVSSTSGIEREDNNNYQKSIYTSASSIDIDSVQAVPSNAFDPLCNPSSPEIVIPDILEDRHISVAEPLVSYIPTTQEQSCIEHMVDTQDKMDVDSESEEVSHEKFVKSGAELSDKELVLESGADLSDKEQVLESGAELSDKEQVLESGAELSDKLLESGAELSDKLLESGAELSDKLLESGAELSDKLLESGAELSDKLLESGAELSDKLLESGAELSDKVLESGAELSDKVLESGDELSDEKLAVESGAEKSNKRRVNRYKDDDFEVEIVDDSSDYTSDDSVIVISSESETMKHQSSNNDSYVTESSDLQSTDNTGVYPLHLYRSSTAGFADSERMSYEDSSSEWITSEMSFSIRGADGSTEIIDSERFRECINNDTATYIMVNEITDISDQCLPPDNPAFDEDYDAFSTFDYFDMYSSSTPSSPIIDTSYEPPRSFSRTNISDPDFPFPIMESSTSRLRDLFKPSMPSKYRAHGRLISTMPDNPNIDIINKLKLLYECHKRVGCKWRIHAYEAAILALARRRKRVGSLREAEFLPSVGRTIAAKIWRIAKTGELKELEEIHNRRWVETIKLFTRAWGISPRIAQGLYKEGFCTIYGLQTKSDLSRAHLVGLGYYEDLKTKMSQEEAKMIVSTVLREVFKLFPNLRADACSSLRRKKLKCGHACILLSLPTGVPNNHKILPEIVARLHQKGYLIDDLIRHEQNGDQTKYVGVFRLTKKDKHRRICITLTTREEQPTALMYLTGPAYFNKAIQQWALKRDMVLDEHSLRFRVLNVLGGTEAVTKLYMSDESLIFQYMGLPYRAPEHRERVLT